MFCSFAQLTSPPYLILNIHNNMCMAHTVTRTLIGIHVILYIHLFTKVRVCVCPPPPKLSKVSLKNKCYK